MRFGATRCSQRSLLRFGELTTYPYTTKLMPANRNGDLTTKESDPTPSLYDVLISGLSTGIGSLPFTDAREAALLSLNANPLLPAAPQLGLPREGMVAQWVNALPEVTVDLDGSIAIDPSLVTAAITTEITREFHDGLLTFLDEAAVSDMPPNRVKFQMCGPLTMGVALVRAGLPAELAFDRAAAAVSAWAPVLEKIVAERLPGAAAVIFLDEPSLVLWTRDDAPLEREQAVDLLSSALAQFTVCTGVHVCSGGDLRLAFETGARVLSVPVSADVLQDADVVARHLDADGWFAWGAVPTDRPVGESADPLWRETVSVWCELTRRGADPVALRTHGIITPACGLAGHGQSQAEHVLRLADRLAARVGDQAAAVKLTVGA